MEEDVGLLAMDWNIRSASFGDRIWRGGDVLLLLILWIRLGGIGSDCGRLPKVLVGDRELKQISTDLSWGASSVSLPVGCRHSS